MSVENLILVIIILSQTFTELFVLFAFSFKTLKQAKSKIILMFLIVLLQMLLSNFLIQNQFRFIFSVVILVLIFYFIFNLKILSALVTGFISIIFISLVELLITFIFLALDFSQFDLINDVQTKFCLNILVSVFSIILLKIPRVIDLIKRFIKNITKSKNLMNSCIIILMAIYLIIAKNALFTNSKFDIIMNFSILFGVIILFIIIFLSDNKNNILQETNKQMLNYVTKYEKIITEQGKVNHEFKNQLMVIRGYAQMNSHKLIEYLDSIVKDSNKAGSSYLISQLNKFPDGGIKGLLYYKLSVIEEEKIKYEINVESGVKTKLNNLSTNMYKNITKILGVLLDNAIDASM